MKHHRVIWLIAFAAVLSALTVAGLRQALVHGRGAGDEGPSAVVREALDLLAVDHAVFERATQERLRAAAVALAQGGLTTAEAYYVLGVQYQRESNLMGAEALFKRAITTKPDWSWPYAALGSLLGRHTYGRIPEAKGYLEKAIDLDPAWGRPYNLMAVLCRAEGDMAGAEAQALAALERDPDEVAAHNNYANLLVALERFDEAETHYRVAIEANARHPKPYYNLACLFSLQGRVDEAVAHLREAFKRASTLRNDAARDPDLDPIRDTPQFHELVFGGTPRET